MLWNWRFALLYFLIIDQLVTKSYFFYCFSLLLFILQRRTSLFLFGFSFFFGGIWPLLGHFLLLDTLPDLHFGIWLALIACVAILLPLGHNDLIGILVIKELCAMEGHGHFLGHLLDRIEPITHEHALHLHARPQLNFREFER
jgi:hypothetical protein